MRDPADNALGSFLRDRRMRLDPASFGLAPGRRRTPGLRREEVAQRAHISATWYTWLEQGRGGAPSADVLDRIARGLMLTEPERNHLHILAFGHPPEARYRPPEPVGPALQRVLDAMPTSAAILRTATWDVLAWNRAATIILTDYSALPPERRNILRLIFASERVRAQQEDWLNVARYVVGAFRADAARAGAGAEIRQLVAELSETSPLFRQLWTDSDIVHRGEGLKRLHHPSLGLLELEFSSFTVETRSDLTMMVYTPISAEALERVRAAVAAQD